LEQNRPDSIGPEMGRSLVDWLLDQRLSVVSYRHSAECFSKSLARFVLKFSIGVNANHVEV